MKLTVLGCSGSFPSARSPASSYLLEHDGHRIVLDLGSGALGALARHADPYAVDAVLLSHLHPDHCADLAGYYVMRRYRPEGAAPALPVRGPAGAAERFGQLYGPRQSSDDQPDFDFVDHADTYQVGPFEITTRRVVHPVTAYALRVSAGGRTLVYSGDTGACDALVELSRGADLALYEASFVGTDNPPGLHLTGWEAGEHATRAGIGRLALTHLVAWYDPEQVRAEAVSRFDGDLELVEPGASYEV
jgi:ribonuclease BN (tRNA processing enzyme)